MASIFDFEDLARHVCGVDRDDEEIEIDEVLMAKFDVDLCTFAEIAAALLPLCVIARSPLSETVYRGFGHEGLFLVLQPVLDAQ